MKKILVAILGILLALAGIWIGSYLYNNLPGYELASFFTAIALVMAGYGMVACAVVE